MLLWADRLSIVMATECIHDKVKQTRENLVSIVFCESVERKYLAIKNSLVIISTGVLTVGLN